MQKHTKKALVLSVLSLMLCVSMLIGTTFAWFTDSVTTGVNTIQSGTLKVDLVDATTEKSVVGEGLSFVAKDGREADKILWEPGCTYNLQPVKVKNDGNLALKYRIFISGLDGDAKLLEAIEWTVTIGGETKDLADFEGYLIPEGKTDANYSYLSDTIVISGHMKESAGNEYQDKSIDGIAITVSATQMTYEFDSEDDQYDKDAEYLDIWDGTADTSWYDPAATTFALDTAEQLAGLAELVDGGNDFAGKTILLTNDMDLYAEDENGEPVSFEPIGSFSGNQAFQGTFDGQGHTISNLYQNGWALANGYWDGPEYGMGLFSLVENTTVKNVNFEGASLPTEANIIGVVAGGAENSVFENINIIGAYLGNHSWYSGGAIGWAEGEVKLINCDIDATSVVSSQWGDFNNANGGLIGGIDPTAAILLKDCDVACVIDAYNDVTSAYEWYSYRSCGMLIGDSGQKDDPDGNNVGDAIAPNVTCENVTVTYGAWANYHYCEFGSAGYPFCRVEAGESTGAYGNARVGEYTDANGNKVVDENHVHNAGEKHNELIVFDQLYGGATGDRYCTYGTATHDGVTVIYNNK